MSDEANEPRPSDPEEQDDRLDQLEEEIDELEDATDEDDELPEELPRAMPPGSAARLDEEPERRADHL